MMTTTNTNGIICPDKRNRFENNRWFILSMRVAAVLGWIIILSLWFSNMTHGQTRQGNLILIINDGKRNKLCEKVIKDMPELKEMEAATLLSFTAKYVEGTTYLIWRVQCEQEGGLFIIERSIDNEHFEQIGFKEGVGAPINQPIMYSWKDLSPKAGMVHYRITKVHKDGSYYQSNIRKVDELLTEKSMLVAGN